MDADAGTADAEDAMDHEFDRTAGNPDKTSQEPREGEPPEQAPLESPALEQPPKGPSAAHFREAARLAAARARKAINKESTDRGKSDAPQASEQVVDEQAFSKAARKRALHVSGRDSQSAESQSTETESTKQPRTSGSSKKNTKEAISQIDERLMLGARMLRAFESQIQRLQAAADRAEAIEPAGGNRETDPPPAPEPNAPQEAILDRAQEVLAELETQTRKAVDTTDSLANSIEIAGAITAGQQQWADQMNRTEASIESRIDSVMNQTEEALHSMEQRFRRVMEIERAVMTRIDQALARLDVEIAPSRAPQSTPERTPVAEAPLIEVEPLKRPEIGDEPHSTNEPPPPVPTVPEEDDALSLGTLSIDPSLLARKRARER